MRTNNTARVITLGLVIALSLGIFIITIKKGFAVAGFVIQSLSFTTLVTCGFTVAAIWTIIFRATRKKLNREAEDYIRNSITSDFTQAKFSLTKEFEEFSDKSRIDFLSSERVDSFAELLERDFSSAKRDIIIEQTIERMRPESWALVLSKLAAGVGIFLFSQPCQAL